MTETGPAIVPCLSYRDAPAAIAWLKEAFGFTENMIVPGPDGTIAHAQLAFGSGLIMVGSERDDELAMRIPCDLGGITQSIYIVVDDADAHYARAVEAGAEIVRELQDTDYGSRDLLRARPRGPPLELRHLPAGHERVAGSGNPTRISRRARLPCW